MSPASRSYRLIRYLAALTIVSYSLPHASASDTPGKLPQLHKQQQEQEQEQQEHSSAQRIPLALEEDVDVAVLLGPESFTELGANPLQDPNATEDSKGALDDLIAELEEQLRVDELTPPATAMTLQRLGEALALRGEHGRSADAFARAVTANKMLFGAVSAQTVDSLTGLGLALLEQERFPTAAAALGRALSARMLNPLERVVTPTLGLTKNLDGLARALANQPLAEEGQEEEEKEEFKGALMAVDHINRVAWHYFVHNWPYDGETVMLKALDSIQKEGNRLGPSRPRDLVISAYLFNLGFLRLSILGDYGSAAEVLLEAQELRAPLLGDLHTLTVEAVVSRGWALMLTGETQLAVEELTSTAEGLLALGGRAATAERLLRQALQGSSDPLGVASYSHVCYTQHVNMLRGWGKDGVKKAEKFVSTQTELSRDSMLSSKNRSVVRARKALGQALMAQVEGKADKEGLLQLSRADKDQLWEEAKALTK